MLSPPSPPVTGSYLTPVELADAIRRMDDYEWSMLNGRSEWFARYGTQLAEDYRQPSSAG